MFVSSSSSAYYAFCVDTFLYFSGPAADWWSTGVMLFEMLTGIPPFNAEHPQVIFDNILNRNIPWPHVPEDMSHEAQDLINKLLTEDPNERLGANGAMEVSF
jgi:serine/threonine protein kinase